MRVGIVDVGANTARLLVADRDDDAITAVREERVHLGLGEEIEANGRLSPGKIEEAAQAVRGHVRRARKTGCSLIEILVTSPGRQSANSPLLLEALKQAAGAPVRLLTAEEEGELAWHGAVAHGANLPETVAVCDVGGGSTQIVVGSLVSGPAWSRSVDLGSLRLTGRTFREDPPSPEEIESARAEIAARFAELAPPLPRAALATGGTARGMRRVVGGELGPGKLETAVRLLTARSAKEITKDFGVDRARAHTLTAGALILSELQRRLGVPLVVARGGLREGAALRLVESAAAATG